MISKLYNVNFWAKEYHGIIITMFYMFKKLRYQDPMDKTCTKQLMNL